MPYSTAAEDRPKLLNPWALGLVGLLCLVALLLVFPSKQDLMLAQPDRVDAVSIAYGELLLKSKPDDDELRLGLAEQLINVGDLNRAKELLSKPVADTYAVEARFLELEADLLLSFAKPQGIDENRRQQFASEISALLAMDLQPARLQQLAELALSFSEPGPAAQAYSRLAVTDPDNAPAWLELGARWYIAAGEQARAAELYQQLQELAATDAQRQHYQLLVFQNLVAAGESPRALDWLDEQLPALSESADTIALLQAGVTEARGHSEQARALAYLQRWHELRPGGPVWLAQAFAVNLSAGQLEKAWQLGQQLYQQQPSERFLRQLAQLGEWAGHPAQALPLWIQLAHTSAAPEDYDHAWLLASQLFDYPQMSELLSDLAELRPLSLDELKALVFALEMQAQPEQGRNWLRRYVQRRPGARDGWRMLAQINRNMQQLQDETQAWAGMARHHRLSEEERMIWAEAHWLQFQPQQAWDVLAELPLDDSRSKGFLELRSELAWALEQDAEVLASLELLRSKDAKLTAEQREQMRSLYALSDPQKALQLSIDLWHERKTLNNLITAMQLAEQLGEWQVLDQLLVESKPYAMQLQGDPSYWQIQVRSANRLGDEVRVDILLAQLLNKFPNQPWAIELYLWTQIDRQHSEGLGEHLLAWQPQARQEGSLWLPYANAFSLLGNVKEALRWYKLYVQANPDDQLVLAGYADTLDEAGQADSAWRLRRHLIALWKKNPTGSQALQPEQFASYLRMLSSVVGVQRARQVSEQALLASGKPSKPMLDAWFERWVAQLDSLNQTGAIDPWLAWASQRGIIVDGNTRLQSALRSVRREELQQWLAKDGLSPESRAEIWLRLGLEQRAQKESLQALNDTRSEGQNSTLRSQAQSVLVSQPRGVQIGWQQIDYGDMNQQGEVLNMASGVGDDYLTLQAANSRYSNSDLLDSGRLGNVQTLTVGWLSPLQDGDWLAEVDLGQNDFANRQGVGLARHWRMTESDDLSLGADWQRETDETGLMHALGVRDSLWLEGLHAFSGRDQASWRVASNKYATDDGSDLGDGWSGALNYSHSLFAQGPQWTVNSGVTWQENNLNGQLPDYMLQSSGGVLVNDATVSDLLPDRFGELYVGSTWQRGEPGALNRAWPQYTWLLSSSVGWQWPENKLAYTAEVGVGVEVLGADELALRAGYNSAPVGGTGQSASQMRLTYSLRFGR